MHLGREKPWCMKKHNKKPSKSNPPKKHRKSIIDPVIGPDLESIAGELDTLARQRLPDGVLQGNLTGYEEEIRQDSILSALTRYLLHNVEAKNQVKHPWHPARALAAALKIQKRDYLKVMAKERKRSSAFSIPDETPSLHLALKRPSDWSTSVIEVVVRESIVIAMRRGQITITHALIAIVVIVIGVPVREIAGCLGMNRRKIYQQLHRTWKIIKDIMDRVECR